MVATYCFAFQIYCDFSGYSDLAIGAGRVLGFDIPLNFKRPFFAANMSTFWERWHISLSTWLRDYLYIPLGGNRRGRSRTLWNIWLTMTLGGLWHGANWNCVLWGVVNGLLLVGHRLFLWGTRKRTRAIDTTRPVAAGDPVNSQLPGVLLYAGILPGGESGRHFVILGRISPERSRVDGALSVPGRSDTVAHDCGADSDANELHGSPSSLPETESHLSSTWRPR